MATFNQRLRSSARRWSDDNGPGFNPVSPGWAPHHFHGISCPCYWNAKFMSTLWWGVIGTSFAVFALKYLGHSIPERFLAFPKIRRTNLLIPIAVLSALVGVQTFSEKSRLVLDHRAIGISVAFVALKLRAPFPAVVILAAVASALAYRFL